MTHYKTCNECNGEGWRRAPVEDGGIEDCPICKGPFGVAPIGLVPVAEGAIIEVNDETVDQMGQALSRWCYEFWGAGLTEAEGTLAVARALTAVGWRAAAGEKP